VTEHQLLLFLIELVVLVVGARLGGELATRAGVPPVVGEICFGILVGPSCFGLLWPEAFRALFPADAAQRSLLQLVGWLGVIFLVLIAGLETRLGVLRRGGRVTVMTWIGGFALPFGAGLALGWLVPPSQIGPGTDRRTFALFIAIAISISAIPVIARILMDLGLLRTTIGMLVISTAVADDTAAWVLLSLVTALRTGGSQGMASVGWTLGGTALFLVLALTVGPKLVRRALRLSRRLRGRNAATFMTLALVFSGGLATQAIGVHLVLGSFVVAVLIGRTQQRDSASDEAIRDVGMAFLIPLFFAYAGLSADLTTLRGPALVVAAAALAVAFVSKILGAALGARLGGLPLWEAAAVGVGLNARGAMELVIAAIGLSLGILTDSMYASLVLIAVVTSLTAGPLLRYCVRRAETAALAAARATGARTGPADRSLERDRSRTAP
jgi:Kef-type K+ transport system membrane component KefB